MPQYRKYADIPISPVHLHAGAAIESNIAYMRLRVASSVVAIQLRSSREAQGPKTTVRERTARAETLQQQH